MLTHNELIDLQPTLQRTVCGNEDALQDANLRLLQHADSIRNPSRYAPRVAKRCAQDARKRRDRSSRQTAITDDAFADPGPTPFDIVCKEELIRLISQEVRKLPRQQRAAIENPTAANRSNHYKGMRKLRDCLVATGLGPDSQ